MNIKDNVTEKCSQSHTKHKIIQYFIIIRYYNDQQAQIANIIL